MMFRFLLLAVTGVSFGVLSSAGVVTVLSAVGLVPRFAGQTHSAKEILVYENMVILGTISGGVFSVFTEYLPLGKILRTNIQGGLAVWDILGYFSLILCGLFIGMFVGCLALAIAEMLDSIPVLARRIGFRHGLGCVIIAVALGKFCGSMFYFWYALHRTA